jgi:hypothetical protein
LRRCCRKFSYCFLRSNSLVSTSVDGFRFELRTGRLSEPAKIQF